MQHGKTSSFPPKALGVIPARYASTRFPGKPLAMIDGLSMIERVYRQATQCRSLSDVVVATDDLRIFEHVKGFGGEVEMTSELHQSGTDRCAEVATIRAGYPVIINIQGDEPYIKPEQIDLLCQLLQKTGVPIGTLIKRIHTLEELLNPNLPKVVTSREGMALYFSRSPIPYLRGHQQDKWLSLHHYFKHIGIYGFRRETLLQLTKLPVSQLERTEGLEQLRWLEHEYPVFTTETELETLAVDVPEDLVKLALFQKS